MKSVPLNSIPLPAWIHDLETDRLVDANAAAVQRYGYSRADFQAMTLCDLSVAEGHGGSVMHRTKAGEELEVTLFANELEDSKTTRLVIAATVAGRAESPRDFLSSDSEVIYEADAAGRFTFVNVAVRNVLGYAPTSLIGRHYSDLVRDDWKETVVQHYRNQRKSGEDSTYYEFPAVAADGRVVWFGQTVQKVVRSDGSISFRAIGRDVTQRKFVDERFHAFMNNSPAAAFIKQPDSRYVYANDLMNRLFAGPGKTVIGRSDSELLPAEVADEIHEADAEVVLKHRSLQVIESAPTVDGKTRQWLTYKFPVIDESGTTFIGGVSLDMTDRIALEQELAAARDAALESARQKAQFLANMSHEIRTPMNGVLGMLGVLLDTNLDADQRDLAQTARSSAEALLAIINDILDFSKIEAGKLTFEMLEFDVRSAVEATIDLLSESARRKGLDIGYVLDPEIPRMLRGDAGRLRQILLNLIGNAVKFTEHGGVVVQVERNSEVADAVALRFRITDTGIGMSAETRENLFQPFMQGDRSTTRSFGGTGLGLAISKQLVNMMQGDIGVESELGCGSSFWFTAQFGRAGEASGVATPRENPRRVLVVEDSTTARHLISFQLTAWGIANDCANDAATALDMMRDASAAGEPYDVVISDLVMPDMDGVALARIVKSSTRFGAPRFVLVTGTTKQFDAAKLADLGVTTWMSKPVKQQQLFHAIFGNGRSEEPPAARPKEAKAPRAGAHGRVLVVDDNVVNQKVTIRQLQKLGVAGDAVGNGVEALQALERISYDLVLMDCQMPEMDGYEATAEIRKREAGSGRHTPVIALTASASPSDRERCLKAGMDDFVTKPVRENDLAAALQRWMKSAERALAQCTA